MSVRKTGCHPAASSIPCNAAISLLLAVIAMLLAAIAAWAVPPDMPQDRSGRDLTEATLEELMQIEITSVAKKEQTLNQAPAAIYVITQEDIRRSGLTSIPELLRLAPGVDVARISSNQWAITARGFNGRFANKLLVLMDGRSVYTTMFSGVYWDTLDTPLDDIERIEVIRGPGATMWGANAVNGVINIITKSAKQTQGGLVTAGGGTQPLAEGSVRYGGSLGPNAFYRVFATYANYDGVYTQTGTPNADNWYLGHAGFRIDWDESDRDSFVLLGDGYGGRLGQNYSVPSPTPPYSVQFDNAANPTGGDALARWHHRVSESSETNLQVYFDRYARLGELGGDQLSTLDLNFQHRWEITSRNELQWGFEVRHTVDNTQGNYVASLTPSSSAETLYSFLLQDEIRLIPDRLFITAGTKIEHNVFTGLEVEPDVRLMWTPSDRNAFWAAVSRSVRTPSRTEEGILVHESVTPEPDGVLDVVTLSGNPSQLAESLLAYQVGYRTQLAKKLSFDATAFYNRYDHLQSIEQGQPTLLSPDYLLIPLSYGNLQKAKGGGMEVAATYIPAKRWKLTGSYSWLTLDLTSDTTIPSPSPAAGNSGSPSNQWQVRSELDLPHHTEWDSALYFVGRIPDQSVAAYARLDTRLGWRASPQVEFSIGGQNLLSPRHIEFYLIDEGPEVRLEVQRSIFGKVTWTF
jgi:iron complex outermembrane recepter protein